MFMSFIAVVSCGGSCGAFVHTNESMLQFKVCLYHYIQYNCLELNFMMTADPSTIIVKCGHGLLPCVNFVNLVCARTQIMLEPIQHYLSQVGEFFVAM